MDNENQELPCENEELHDVDEIETLSLSLSVNGTRCATSGGVQNYSELWTRQPKLLESLSGVRTLGSEAVERQRTIADLTPAELVTFCVTLDVHKRWHTFFTRLGLDAEEMKECKDGHAPLTEVLVLLTQRKPNITVEDLCRVTNIQADVGELRSKQLLSLRKSELETLSYKLYTQLGSDDTLWKKVAASFNFSVQEIDYMEANFCSRSSHSQQLFRCLAAKKPKTLIEDLKEIFNEIINSDESEACD